MSPQVNTELSTDLSLPYLRASVSWKGRGDAWKMSREVTGTHRNLNGKQLAEIFLDTARMMSAIWREVSVPLER